MRIRNLFRYEQTSGLLMIGAMLLALAAANSPLQFAYQAVHHTPVHVRFGPLVIDQPLVQWINDGLMVLFFVAVGLEIKRQFLEGHLKTASRAALPAFAALGGMAVPALIYATLNWREPRLLHGWAIPTATDIVLAIGVLSLLGSRVPTGLKVFLTAVAIFDDIGAVLIIGVFYGEKIAWLPLVVAAVSLAGLALLNVRSTTRPQGYVVLGLVLWIALLKSGVEAALAGVLIAFAVPLRVPGCACSSPLREVEGRLHPWVTLGIVPLFAFFNSGIALVGDGLGSLLSPVSLGVIFGLFLGKQIGVFGTAWLASKLGVGALPPETSWTQLYGAALLAGIGFTMSLFVASLSFADPDAIAAAKLAILIGSALSAMTGLLILSAALRKPQTT